MAKHHRDLLTRMTSSLDVVIHFGYPRNMTHIPSCHAHRNMVTRSHIHLSVFVANESMPNTDYCKFCGKHVEHVERIAYGVQLARKKVEAAREADLNAALSHTRRSR